MLLPVGPAERHGPHLPTGVDGFLSAEACRRAAGIMVAQDRPVPSLRPSGAGWRTIMSSSAVRSPSRALNAISGEISRELSAPIAVGHAVGRGG
ncbi:creatininase family protein [Streptomyces rapamycinicus]|uniref:Creatininase n=1 Tax=Streptomyces rapamycinicus TaxID=1226757 RepID=A0ABR6LL55_9ACTN|nr:creatininase family protein [Streptomyces rapamycinicus]MBB4782806.1 hypothetical protein [Streptomyces rapamycinicus]